MQSVLLEIKTANTSGEVVIGKEQKEASKVLVEFYLLIRIPVT